MYMEAYGQVGSWADSVIQKSLTSAITRKIAKEDAKEVLPKQEVSPSEGGSDKATPQTTQPQADINKLNDELTASNKARASLEKKVTSINAKYQYQKDLTKLWKNAHMKQLKKEMVGVK